MNTPTTDAVFEKEMPAQLGAFIDLCRTFETALRQILAIPNNYDGADWKEIDIARQIASAAVNRRFKQHD